MSFWGFMDRHGSLFALPLVIAVASFIAARLSNDWVAIAYAVWLVVSLLALILAGVFLALNHYVFEWRLNWWRNALLSMGLLLLSSVSTSKTAPIRKMAGTFNVVCFISIIYTIIS